MLSYPVRTNRRVRCPLGPEICTTHKANAMQLPPGTEGGCDQYRQAYIDQKSSCELASTFLAIGADLSDGCGYAIEVRTVRSVSPTYS